VNPAELSQIGPYTVVRFVAEGGMAWVFEVTDPKFEVRRLALKLLKPEAAMGAEFERFRDEARLLAGIDHPYLVTIFDFGKDEETGCFFYTMNFIDGPTMAQRITESGAFDVEEGGRLFVQVLDGLSELHRRRIVHRDIKPANVLIGADGRARLADLGIARQQQQETGRTRTGTAIGTVAYMSPEQARGQTVGAQSDVFSMGLTLYEALTGQTVYQGVEDLDSTSSYEVLGYLVSLARTGEEIGITYPAGCRVPQSVRDVITRACRFYADDRYPDAAEMRDALEQALRPQPEVVVQAAHGSRWPLIAAVAALGVLVVAVFVYQIVKQGQAESQAKQSLERAHGLLASVPGLLDRVKDVQPRLGRESLERADDTLERARNYLVDCEEEFELEEFAVSDASCDRARERAEEMCRQLVEDVGTRAQQRVDAAGQRVAALRENAASYAPKAWGELEKTASALGPPDADAAPCEGLEAQLVRIDGAGQALALASDVEKQLEAIWPRLVETARHEAETARTNADADVDAGAYTAARGAGEETFGRAQALEKAGDLLEARDTYQQARDHFDAAAAIVPAARERERLRIFEKTIPAGLSLPSVVSRIAYADDLYLQGEWEKAADAYRDALQRAKTDLDKEELKRAADLARAKALAAKEGAVAEGAQSSAGGAFSAADELLASAQQAWDSEDYQDAESGFHDALSRFVEAREEAIQALGTARDQVAGLQRDAEALGDCAKLESGTARTECQSAQAELARASEALDTHDAPGVLNTASAARAALERARAAENEFLATKPRPPEITARAPTRDTIEIFRNRGLTASVEATDPNGDALRYAWSFDGQPLEERRAEIELRPEKSGRLTVEVDDSRGYSVRESWNVVVKNRKPKVAVSPGTQTVTLAAGSSSSFSARVSDPDGDSTQTVFLLNGRKVASGTSWRLDNAPAGRHKLEVVATDAAGARTTVTRTLEVKATTVADSRDAGTRPPPPSPPPPGDNPGIREALERYENCLNRRDMGCLEKVWILPAGSIYRKRWERKFSSPDPFQVDVTIQSIQRRGDDQATVLYHQREASPNKSKVWPYKAVLLKRTTDEWQIIENALERSG
jgi:hypothetical protein